MTLQQRKDEIFQRLRNTKLMDKYYSAKNERIDSPISDNIISGINFYDGIKGIKPYQMNSAISSGANTADSTVGNAINSNIAAKGLGGSAISNAANAQINGASKAAGAFSKVGGAMQGVGQAVGKAVPAVNAITGGVSAVNNFANGNNVDGALDLAKTGLSFIPGVGWVAAGAIQIAQMLKGAKEKADQKAMLKSQEEAFKSQQLAENEIDATKQGLEQQRQENLANMQSQMQQAPSNEQITQDILAQYNTGKNSQADIDQFGKGNINLYDRPLVKNSDGTTSTVKSMSFNDGQNEILIPTVSDSGRIMSNDEAIDNYYQTGKYLGKFNSVDEANSYAEQLHKQQDKYYNGATGAAAPALPFDGSASQELDNNEAQKQSIMSLFKSLGNSVSNGIRDFSKGYQDNSQHGFMEGDLYRGLANNEVIPSQTENGTITGGANELKKTLMNRVGELAGTGARVMSNPWTQAGIAALATKATGGDWADSLNNAYSYGTAKATSNYYDKKLNPDKAPSALSRFTKDDYNANTLSRYRDTMADNNSMRVKADLDKNMPTLEDWYNTLLYTGEMSLEDYNKAITAPDYNPTARINIAGYKAVNDKNYKKESNDIKWTKVNNDFELGKEKNGIARTNANTNAGRLEETKTSHRNAEALNEKKYNFSVQKYNQRLEDNKQKAIDKGLSDGSLIRMKAPDGSTAIVKIEDVAKYRKMGAKVL